MRAIARTHVFRFSYHRTKKSVDYTFIDSVSDRACQVNWKMKNIPEKIYVSIVYTPYNPTNENIYAIRYYVCRALSVVWQFANIRQANTQNTETTTNTRQIMCVCVCVRCTTQNPRLKMHTHSALSDTEHKSAISISDGILSSSFRLLDGGGGWSAGVWVRIRAGQGQLFLVLLLLRVMSGRETRVACFHTRFSHPRQIRKRHFIDL